MRAAIFDLDGTLVDSGDDICAAFAFALEEVGHEAPPPERVRPLIGLPLADMFARFAPERDVEALAAAYRARYWERCADRTRPHARTAETLAELREGGWRIGVATTKRTPMARRVLGRLGLLDAIDWVQGSDELPVKPAPDVVERALAEMGVAPTRDSWMVGDTVGDVLAGRAAGVSTAAVTTGAHEATELAAAEPDLLVDGLAEVGVALGAAVRG